MTRLLGVLMMVVLLYAFMVVEFEGTRSAFTQQTIAQRLGFYGVLTVGVGVLIVSGGIDLSIGSVISLGAVTFMLLVMKGWAPWAAAAAAVAGGALIGLCHGLLVTGLGLQPFLVTLCGLFVYRGLARWVAGGDIGFSKAGPDAQQPLDSLRDTLFARSVLGVPDPLLLLLAVTALMTVLLHGTKYGRYLYAIGANEEAARYAGIPTARYKVLAYVICSTLAALGSVLFVLENRGVNPTSAGTLMELYAITGAVLGGCSLRGGVGMVPGMFLGAAVLPLLKQLITSSSTPDSLEWSVIGVALLLGTIADEVLKRRAARRA